MTIQDSIAATGNPIIRNKYTADPTALVYNNTVYIYTGHDEAPVGTETYVMNDWLCFSSTDMVTWREHPVPLKALDFSWAKGDAYASKVIYCNNKFYWYVAVTHASVTGKAIGVAIAAHPAGPFADGRGSALITHDMLEALLLADRIVVMREGKLVADGTPADLMRHQDAFVNELMQTPRRHAEQLNAFLAGSGA